LWQFIERHNIASTALLRVANGREGCIRGQKEKADAFENAIGGET
jgi:hypothetical protein